MCVCERDVEHVCVSTSQCAGAESSICVALTVWAESSNFVGGKTGWSLCVSERDRERESR